MCLSSYVLLPTSAFFFFFFNDTATTEIYPLSLHAPLPIFALVGMGFINHVVKLIPTGLEPKPREKSLEAVRAMFYAVEKNNPSYAQKVLEMNFDPSLHHENGYTPLAYAAAKGNLEMVELLLRNGADPTQVTREGDTPVELALRFGHGGIADVLKRARQAFESGGAPQPHPAY